MYLLGISWKLFLCCEFEEALVKLDEGIPVWLMLLRGRGRSTFRIPKGAEFEDFEAIFGSFRSIEIQKRDYITDWNVKKTVQKQWQAKSLIRTYQIWNGLFKWHEKRTKISRRKKFQCNFCTYRDEKSWEVLASDLDFLAKVRVTRFSKHYLINLYKSDMKL